PQHCLPQANGNRFSFHSLFPHISGSPRSRRYQSSFLSTNLKLSPLLPPFFGSWPWASSAICANPKEHASSSEPTVKNLRRRRPRSEKVIMRHFLPWELKPSY